MYGKNVKNFIWAHYFIKKWEELQAVLDKSKSEVEQGDY